MTKIIVDNRKIKPLNVFNARRTEFCPPYFESVTVSSSFRTNKMLEEWIYANLAGRYYFGTCLEIEDDNAKSKNQYRIKVKIAFEETRELNFFLLACPVLKDIK